MKIVPANPKHTFKDRKFLTFENLTFVPIQKKMQVIFVSLYVILSLHFCYEIFRIIPEMLTSEEVSLV